MLCGAIWTVFGHVEFDEFRLAGVYIMYKSLHNGTEFGLEWNVTDVHVHRARLEVSQMSTLLVCL
jgi:hypothetical protein